MIIAIVMGSNVKDESINTYSSTINPVKVAVVVNDINGLYVSEVVKSLKDIQNENEGKVEFTFFSSNEKQDIQNEIVDGILQDKEFKLLLVELVDINAPQQVIDKVKENNVPIVLFSREPPNKDHIKSYQKSIFVGTVTEQAGMLEGEILVNEWNKNKSLVDKNPLEGTKYKFDDTGVTIRIPYKRYIPD